MRNWIGVGAVLLLVSACQNKSNSVSRIPSPSGSTMQFQMPRTLESSDQLNFIFNQTIVTCEDGKCPEGVGTFLAWEPFSETKVNGFDCTAFLVSSTIAATNSHCVPDRVKQHPELCATYVGLKFPAQNNKPTESVACDRLIQASEIPPGDVEMKFALVDFAFIRLQHEIKREVFVVARDGVKDETPLTVYSSDPPHEVAASKKKEEKARIYTIRKKTCVSKQNTILLPQYSTDVSNFVLGLNSACSFEKGNSGAPAINSDGEVAAILFAQDPTAVERIKDFLKSIDGTGDPQVFAHNAYFVNFACLNVAKEVALAPMSGECSGREQKQKANEEQELKNSVKDENEEISRVGAEWFKAAPKILRYFPVRNISDDPHRRRTITMDYQLECLLPKDYWALIQPSTSDNRLVVKYTSRLLVYQVQLDSNGRKKEVKITDKSPQITITIDASLVGTSDSVVGTKVVDGVSSSFSTHWCSGPEITSR